MKFLLLILLTGSLMATDYYCKMYQITTNGSTLKASDNPNLPPMYKHFQRNGNGNANQLKIYSKKSGVIQYMNYNIVQSANFRDGQHIQEYDNPNSTFIVHVGDNFKTGVRMFSGVGYTDFVKCRTSKPKNAVLF